MPAVRSLLLISALAALAWGCDNAPATGPLDAVTATDPAAAQEPLRVMFDCGDNRQMTVDFDRAGGTATVQPPAGMMVMLPQRPTASGFRYESDGYELSGKGDEVRWVPLMGDPLTCTVIDEAQAAQGQP